jgi:hypothetical protein
MLTALFIVALAALFLAGTRGIIRHLDAEPTVEVEVLADSVSEAGKRITTFLLTYPRSIHAELMTHRRFSRNASSSRAIPISKTLRQVWFNPQVPMYWGSAKKGMQSGDELSRGKKLVAQVLWILLSRIAVITGWLLDKAGLHKQFVNRLLEPWNTITVIVTSTEWDNFYYLRCNPAAEPTMQALAMEMLRCHNESVPKLLRKGEWHLPLLQRDEYFADSKLAKMASVARCARTSYLNHDNSYPDHGKDFNLHDQLSGAGHWSPFEHQATPLDDPNQPSGNFLGWKQYRQEFYDEVKQFPLFEKKWLR